MRRRQIGMNKNETWYLINSITDTIQLTPPPPAPVAHRQILNDAQFSSSQTQQQQQSKQESEIQAALKDIRTSLQRSKVMTANNSPSSLYNTNNVSNMMNNNNSYYDRTPVIPEKIESPAMSLSPVWIPRYFFTEFFFIFLHCTRFIQSIRRFSNYFFYILLVC